MQYIGTDTPVREAYYDAINGNLTYNGENVPVYDSFAPEEDIAPYVVITDQTATSEPATRCRFRNGVTIQMEIVMAFPPGVRGGKSITENIADQIYTIVLSKESAGYLSFDPTLYNGKADLDFSTYLTQLDQINGNNVYIYRKIIRFRHTITQITEN